MIYTSTRNGSVAVSSCVAIANGISPEGGLYVPRELPVVSRQWIEALVPLTYYERAAEVLKLFLTDFSEEELGNAVKQAYFTDNFEENEPAPLADLSDGRFVLELWRGPTCAFKDIALQILPQLMATASKKAMGGKKILILVATSGDTGKAALEGFKDAEGISLAVFYPHNGVSAMQKLQMASQQGSNVAVYAIEGNFDDAQRQVKAIFTDKMVCEALAEDNIVLSSANSINWGRLAPQIVYYFSAYAQLLSEGKLTAGEKLNFTVPTGNFGNILAGYYAMKMGLPINKLICASNSNNILTDFLTSGEYNANRDFHTTLSPSMDILVSSNLERLLYELSGKDANTVASLMGKLAKNKRYTVEPKLREDMAEIFVGGCLNDTECKQVIGELEKSHGYLCDTHTAVAMGVYDNYRRKTGDTTKTVIVSTASPYKFAPAVLEALGQSCGEDEFAAVNALSKLTSTQIPAPITGLENAKIRFTKVIPIEAMANAVIAFSKGE